MLQMSDKMALFCSMISQYRTDYFYLLEVKVTAE